MGKIVGGGLPAAAYGGRRALMERIAPAGDVYQAGTLSGNPLAVAAALATLRELDDAASTRGWPRPPSALAEGLRDAAARRGRAGHGAVRPRSVHRVLHRAPAGHRLRRRGGLRHRRPTAPGAGRCWRAASTRPPRSSRPGSRRWRTPTATSSDPAGGRRGVCRGGDRMSLTALARRARRPRAARSRSSSGPARRADAGDPGPGAARGLRPSRRRAPRPSTSCCWS